MHEIGRSLCCAYLARKDREFPRRTRMVTENTFAANILEIILQQIDVPACTFVWEVGVVGIVNCMQAGVEADVLYRISRERSLRVEHIASISDRAKREFVIGVFKIRPTRGDPIRPAAPPIPWTTKNLGRTGTSPSPASSVLHRSRRRATHLRLLHRPRPLASVNTTSCPFRTRNAVASRVPNNGGGPFLLFDTWGVREKGEAPPLERKYADLAHSQ